MIELEKRKQQEKEWTQQYVLTEKELAKLILDKVQRAESKQNLVGKWRESAYGCS